MELPEPLWELPSPGPPIVGACTSLPGFELDLVHMQQLGIPESLLANLADGVSLNFSSHPEPYYQGNHSSASRDLTSARTVHQDLMRLYDVGKLSDCGADCPVVCNPLGLVEKGSKIRVVVDASISGVNDCQDLIYFGLPTAESFLQQMRPGSFLCKLDVSDAYLKIPVRPDEARFLGVKDPLTGRFLQYNFLPFGSRNSGPLFCIVMAEVIKAIRREWDRYGVVAEIGNYSDDSMIVADSYGMCLQALAVAYTTFNQVGMFVKASKIEYPAQSMEFIGVLFDTVSHRLAVTEKRKAQLLASLQEILLCDRVSFGALETLIGRLTFAQTALLGIAPSMQSLYRFLPRRLTSWWGQKRQKSQVFPLSQLTRAALGSISDRLMDSSSRQLHVGPTGQFYLWNPSTARAELADVEIDTDASGDFGWGVRWIGGGESRAGQWSSQWLPVHINIKELYCILIALRWWGHSWAKIGSRVLAHCDSSAAVGCLNKLRSPSEGMGQLCIEINDLCLQHSIELVAVHKPGHLNVVPDALSRGLLAPWTTSFTLTARGVSHVCRVGRVRGCVQRLVLSAAAIRWCSPGNGTVVGILPSSGQIDTLRSLLALRLGHSTFQVLICVPAPSLSFISECWPSYRKYYRRQGFLRANSIGLIQRPDLSAEWDNGTSAVMNRMPWPLIILTFRGMMSSLIDM